jgi:chromosome partitioning protein
MLTIAITALSGGQGKTTASLLLGRALANLGYPTLMIDADPQHNLTTYLDLELQPNQPTLLEFLKKSVSFEDAIYPIEGLPNLFLIPADDQLDVVQDYLSNSGVGATMLLRRLEPIADTFKVCVIDSPPQRSQICLTVIGAADFLIIPAEASVKGYGSFGEDARLTALFTGRKGDQRTRCWGFYPLETNGLVTLRLWKAASPLTRCGMKVGTELMLPSIRESERYKQAINKRTTLAAMGYADLEYPIDVIRSKIQQLLEGDAACQTVS